MTYRLPTMTMGGMSDVPIVLAEQTDEWLAEYVTNLRRTHISYAEWRRQGKELPADISDDDFDAWALAPVTALIDAIEDILLRRAAALEASKKEPHLKVVK